MMFLRHICPALLFPHLAATAQSSAHTLPPSQPQHLLLLVATKTHAYLSISTAEHLTSRP